MKDQISFKGSTNLKPLGISFTYTENQIKEILKCKDDPIYFIKTYCKIVSLDHEDLVNFDLYPYQERFLNAVHENRLVVSMQPRQQGKTISIAAYCVWYIVFQSHKTVGILANKSDTAREILSRCKLMYESLPLWMQHGIEKWNEGSIKLENGSRIFVGATSKSGIRGKSCVTGDTRVCIEHNDSYHYVAIEYLINNREFINKESIMLQDIKYTVYKTTNKINNKIYIGFHKIKSSHILAEYSDIGSVYLDGYLGSGKIIKDAIEKYGPESFSQEILGIFDEKEDAEDFEASLVDKGFTLREDTYNIAIGGNTRIMCGENNPFHGRNHSPETIDKIQYTRNLNNLPTFQTKIINLETNEIYKGYKEALDKLGYVEDASYSFKYGVRQHNIFLGRLCLEEKIKIDKEEYHNSIIENYLHYLYMVETENEREENFKKLCSINSTGRKQSKESIEKIVLGHKKWIVENPEKHNERMEKINKNPEKIRKTAEKHRGMKRSDEARKNISDALIGKPSHSKGRVIAYNPNDIDPKMKYFDSTDEIPDGWIRGYPKRESKGILYNDGITQKFFKNKDDVPDGWILGGLPKPRKIK